MSEIAQNPLEATDTQAALAYAAADGGQPRGHRVPAPRGALEPVLRVLRAAAERHGAAAPHAW